MLNPKPHNHEPNFTPNPSRPLIAHLSLVFRIESTFKCSGVYSFDDMVEVFVKVSPLILRDALVVSSIDQHITSLEKCINEVTVLYNPSIAQRKAQYREEYRDYSPKVQKCIEKKLNATPEGVIINHFNSDTGKFNGHIVTSKGVGQSFSTLTKQVALQAACGVRIVLWTLVRGGEESGLSYCYYKKDQLSKVVTSGGTDETHMRMYPSLKSVDEYMADWGAMGVDVSRHTKLRFACITTGSHITASRLCLDVKVDESVNAQELMPMITYDDNVSEIFERIHEQARVITAIDDMPYYSEFQPWDRFKYHPKGLNNRGSQPIYAFYLDGFKYKLPPGFFDRVHAWCKDKTNATVLIKNSEEHGFECVLPETEEEVQQGDEPAFVRPLRESRRPKKADDLPVSAEPMLILGGGQVSLKASKQGTTIYVQEPDGSDGYYNLPPSLRNKLRAHLRLCGAEDDLDGQLLAGYSIMHTEAFRGRQAVKLASYSKSYEEKMIILDSSGTEVARTESKADSEMGPRAGSKRKR